MADISGAKVLIERLIATENHPSSQEDTLVKLKILTRDSSIVEKLFTSDVIALLARYGISHGMDEALRCLANALLQVPSTRQAFIDAGFAGPACDSLRDSSPSRDFLLCRILFLLTYNTSLDFRSLDQEHGLCKTMVQLCQKASASDTTPSLDETLKLLFNITHFFPALVNPLTPAVKPIASMLTSHPVQSPPLQTPTSSIINALLNLNLQSAALAITKQDGHGTIDAIVDRLVVILDKATNEYGRSELDTIANPLCTLLRKIYELGDSEIQARLQKALLPQDEDRKRPLGEGDTLAARLLRLAVSPELPNLGNNISSLLYELSDKDSERFVHNIGYGYASGFLMNHGMAAPIPNDTTIPVTEPVNPITGQRRAEEPVDGNPLDDMTDEEKEREAERLFVLFERLKATGVVKVQNPVERLYRGGG